MEYDALIREAWASNARLRPSPGTDALMVTLALEGRDGTLRMIYRLLRGDWSLSLAALPHLSERMVRIIAQAAPPDNLAEAAAWLAQERAAWYARCAHPPAPVSLFSQNLIGAGRAGWDVLDKNSWACTLP